MRAIMQEQYGRADQVLELRDVEQPAVGEHDVLIRVRAAGVDPGVWHLMTGLPYMVRLGYGLRAPRTRVRGVDVAGVVEALGTNVTRFRPGDEVYGTTMKGSFAEFARAPEEKLARKPSNLTFEQAAAVPVSGGTALQSLRDKGRIRPGQRVLVTGASGGVGSFAVQLAKALGGHVTGVCSTSKVDMVLSIGADDVIDYTRQDFADGTRRYDLILDNAGRRPLRHLRRALEPKGTLVIVGGEGGGRWLGGFDRGFRAAMLSPFVGQKLKVLVAKDRSEDLEFLTELIEAGKVTPVLDRTFPLSQAADAIEYWEQGHARGKVVVTV
jgi:NADPH:quinone reductase-like Zn-dependent oxidoreductase